MSVSRGYQKCDLSPEATRQENHQNWVQRSLSTPQLKVYVMERLNRADHQLAMVFWLSDITRKISHFETCNANESIIVQALLESVLVIWYNSRRFLEFINLNWTCKPSWKRIKGSPPDSSWLGISVLQLEILYLTRHTMTPPHVHTSSPNFWRWSPWHWLHRANSRTSRSAQTRVSQGESTAYSDFDRPGVRSHPKEADVNCQYGVLVCRQTGLDDHRHVALSKLFGELDDVTPYNKLGRINRLAYDEWETSWLPSFSPLIQLDTAYTLMTNYASVWRK